MTDPVGVLYLRLLPKLLHQRDFLLSATNKPEHPQKGRAEGAKLDFPDDPVLRRRHILCSFDLEVPKRTSGDESL